MAEREALIAFLNTVARPGGDLESCGDELSLIDADLIDSFALIQIISWLEEQHGVQLHRLGIDPADLASIGGILAAIERTDK